MSQSLTDSDDPLSPDEAAPIVGVPAVQLRRWACDKVGPKNIGTRYRPKYREADLTAWLKERAHA